MEKKCSASIFYLSIRNRVVGVKTNKKLRIINVGYSPFDVMIFDTVWKNTETKKKLIIWIKLRYDTILVATGGKEAKAWSLARFWEVAMNEDFPIMYVKNTLVKSGCKKKIILNSEVLPEISTAIKPKYISRFLSICKALV